jgi:photosystem II 13kDa protein
MVASRFTKINDIIMAQIQFSRGVNEDAIPDVRLTRAKDGTNGTATFYFDKPNALSNNNTEDITGMYLIDEEGELTTREVKAKFVNGQPQALEATYIMKSTQDWDRFMRFMQRYAQENGLEFSKSK